MTPIRPEVPTGVMDMEAEVPEQIILTCPNCEAAQSRDLPYSMVAPDKCSACGASFGCSPPMTGELEALLAAAPIPMLLYCPACGEQHIDVPEDGFHEGDDAQSGAWSPGWDNPPHRSHLCHGCGCIWRPADVATEGVRAIGTIGKADTWTPADGHPLRAAEERVAVLTAELQATQQAHERLLRSVLAAIDTGRSKPLFIVRDQLRNYLAYLTSTSKDPSHAE